MDLPIKDRLSRLSGWLLLVVALMTGGCPAPSGPDGPPRIDPQLAELLRVAEAGDADAQVRVGDRYLVGQGVAQDYRVALEWYQRAADQDHPMALCRIGTIHDLGRGVPRDMSEALRWYRRAAEAGDAEAAFNMATTFDQGRGVTANPKEAIGWYRKAAEAGHAGAQQQLGLKHFMGRDGLRADPAEAARWYRFAAERGEPSAQTALATLLDLGQGVPTNRVEAYGWFSIAAARGHQAAVRFREEAATTLTPDELSAGAQFARDYRPKQGPIPGVDARAASGSASARSKRGAEADGPFLEGRGFFVTEDGWIATSSRLLEGGNSVRVVHAGGTQPARIVRRDDANDLALLRVETKSVPLPVGPSRGARIGQSVALPESSTLTTGTLTALTGIGGDPKQFATSISAPPGQAGAPLLDTRGNVLGLVSYLPPAAGAGSRAMAVSVVKSSYLLSLLESVPELSQARLLEPSGAEGRWEEMAAAVVPALVRIQVYR